MKISITESAKKELNNISQDNEKGGRIILTGSKCSTGEPQFSLSVDKEKEDDIVVDVEGIKILVQKNLEEIIDNISIDYEEEGLKRGFNIILK